MIHLLVGYKMPQKGRKVNRRKILGMLSFGGIASLFGVSKVIANETNSEKILIGWALIESHGYSSFFELNNKYTPPPWMYKISTSKDWKPIMNAEEMARFLATRSENAQVVPVYANKNEYIKHPSKILNG